MIKVEDLVTDGMSLGKRDAYHIPAVVVTSDDRVRSGDKLRFVDTTKTKVEVVESDGVALADPFLKAQVKPGSMFLALLRPEFVTTVKHHFDVLEDRPSEDDEGYDDPDCPGGSCG